MSSNRYYFSNFIEDDTLGVLAISAKEMLQQLDSIVQMYQNNNEILYGQSPKQMLFLMKQNNKPLYPLSRSPSCGKNSFVVASNPGPSTPISRNADVSILRRILVPNSPIDNTEGKSSIFGIMENKTSVIHQTIRKSDGVLSSNIDETGKVDEQVASPVSSTGGPQARYFYSPQSAKLTLVSECLMDNKEVEDSLKVLSDKDKDDEESPQSSKLTRMTDSLTVKEKDTSFVLNRSDGEVRVGKQESSEHVGVIRHTSNLELHEKDSISCAKGEHKIDAKIEFLKPEIKFGESQNIDSLKKDLRNQEVEIFKIPSPMKVEHEFTKPVETVEKVLLKDDQTATKIDFHKKGEKFEKSETADLNIKDPINPAEGVVNITHQVKYRKDTLSPIKKSKIYSFSDVNIKEFSSPTDNVKLKDSLPEVSKLSTSPFQDDITNVSQNEESPKAVVETRKRKSLSPKPKSKIYSFSDVDIKEFSSPTENVKLIDSLPEDSKLSTSPFQDDITNVNLNEESPKAVVETRKRKSPSPKPNKANIFRSLPRVIQSVGEAHLDIEVPCHPEDNPSPTTSRISSAVNSLCNISPGLNADESTRTIGKSLSPSERVISLDFASRLSSLGSTEYNIYGDNKASDTSSNIKTLTGDRSSNSEFNFKYNETEYFDFKDTVTKFNTLYSLRQDILQKVFTSLLCFQDNLDFLYSYAVRVGFFVNAISLPDKQYFTKELKEIVNEVTVMVENLMKKFTPWKKDIDMDVNTWQKCIEQIQLLKAQYEPFMSNDDEPLITIETLQVYEHELKSIWKRIDEIIMMGDTRRTLFSQTAYDFEKLIKSFVNCLIMVGVLQPH